MGAWLGPILLVACATAGCLSAPPENGKPDAGDPSCTPIVSESFDDPTLDDAVWDTDVSGPGAVTSDGDSILLTSPPDPAGAYAQIELRSAASLASTVLRATFSAETTGDGDVYFNLRVTEDDELSFFVQDGRLLAEYEVAGDDEPLCDPCPPYAGEVIMVRVTSDEARSTFDWRLADGDTTELFAQSPALLPGAATLQVETYAIGSDSASVTIEELTWSACSP